ncbi:hypothetical protein [Noviherbaspirillum pedocola]|uniref:Uncharacterized protein n=1 Tax=Noviherbaspirillum pedocola TaxID=2801341 RepID=A0A934W6E7_9BURK|nr:hypothetical protein [Noviherbaspirillum pedocola]MBK4736137.1 hypothetical protein [Noviherbaspirillum pedocola]
MKLRLRDALRLKPFDESAESGSAMFVYYSSPSLMVGAVVTVLLAVAAAGLAIAGFSQAMDTIYAGLGVGAITTGLEWNAGLKARSLNHLFLVLLVLGALAVSRAVFG